MLFAVTVRACSTGGGTTSGGPCAADPNLPRGRSYDTVRMELRHDPVTTQIGDGRVGQCLGLGYDKNRTRIGREKVGTRIRHG